MKIGAAADVPMAVLGQFQKFFETAAVLRMIDFHAVEIMGQDFIQCPFQQSRMG